MGEALTAEPGFLFCACMIGEGVDYGDVLGMLSGRYGRVAFSYGPVPFTYTDYYREEMGGNLSKAYVVFEPFFDRRELPNVKTCTNSLEQRLAREGKRRINLDPGYLARDKLVLATTKDFFHRIYLGDGIYGEVTLHFRRGRYRHFSWTYADYREQHVLEMLEKARARLVEAIRRMPERKPAIRDEQS